MGIILDIIIILIIGLNIYLGYKKGLIEVAFNVFAFFIAIIATLILFNPISNLVIQNTEIDENIKKSIISNFNKDEKENIDNNNNYIDKTKEKDSNIISIYINEKIKDLTDDINQVIFR